MNCKDCPHQAYKQLTKADILAHLQGKSHNGSDVIGVYPLLKNGTCRFLVFDFDNHESGAGKNDFANTGDAWIEEVEAMRTICCLNGIDPLVERSRSGRGAHIWIFFDKPVQAALARKFGFALLDKGAEQVNLKSFQYYDRMLPAQDTLPEETLALVATGSLIGEGFDFQRLDTLIMATPVSFQSVVEQYAGRLNRDYAGKENVIVYDYVDAHIPMFDKMYLKRLKAYRQIGYELCAGLHG